MSPEEEEHGVSEGAVRARKWLREQASKRTSQDTLYGMLADLELSASGFYLGLDYDEDTSDVDDIGPF